MGATISKGYFVTKDGDLKYAENWYDEDSGFDYDFYCEGLSVFSNERDYSSFGDGKDYKSAGPLFSDFVSHGQFDIKKLVEKLGITVQDYLDYSYRCTDYDEDIEAGKIGILDIDASDLKDFLTDYFADYCDIPSWVFSSEEILAKDHPFYSQSVSTRNYSSAGDVFYDYGQYDDNEPDQVFWLTREELDNWGTEEALRQGMLKSMVSTFENWANGRIYGLTYREWDKVKKCWTEEEHIGGFIGDDYYDLEVLLTEEWSATKTEGVRHPVIPVEDSLVHLNTEYGFDAFNVELNDGVLYEREHRA